VTEIRRQVELRVDFDLGSDPVELEHAIASEGRRAARELYELVLQFADEASASNSGGTRQRREPRWLTTLVGRLRISRYRIRVENNSVHPLDQLMGFNRAEASAAVRNLVFDLSRKFSYREIARLVTEFTGEPFSYQQVARLVRDEKQQNAGGQI
jgi:hypothetical protein